ncbi:hypothetical protein CPB85DRAFT_1335246 [Mucidula mucida]|nr:hypothetical protein CPB85DRAFT_1335246 [Mucidula mucida]
MYCRPRLCALSLTSPRTIALELQLYLRPSAQPAAKLAADADLDLTELGFMHAFGHVGDEYAARLDTRSITVSSWRYRRCARAAASHCDDKGCHRTRRHSQLDTGPDSTAWVPYFSRDYGLHLVLPSDG